MMIQQLHPLSGKPVKVRRLVVSAAKAGDVGEPEVVRHDQHDVWPDGSGLRAGSGLRRERLLATGGCQRELGRQERDKRRQKRAEREKRKGRRALQKTRSAHRQFALDKVVYPRNVAES